MGFLIEIVIPMYFIVYFLEPYFPNIIGTVSIIPFLLLFLIPASYKLNIKKQANLLEYKVEEYKGEIESG